MKKLIKKRTITFILLAITSTILIALVGCGGFNEDSAKKESKVELDSFFKAADTETSIANETEMKKIRAFVDNNCKKYFTNDFIKDNTDLLSTKSYADNIFYLSLGTGKGLKKVNFFNKYIISSPTVDTKQETVTYNLKSDDWGVAPTMNVSIQMKMENKKWKINKVITQ